MPHLHSLCVSAIPKVIIDPPSPGELPPNHHNRIPDIDGKRESTTIRPPVTQRRIFPYIPKSTTVKTTMKATTTTKAPLLPNRLTPPHKPAVSTRRPFVPTRKPAAPTRKPYIPPPPPPPVTPVDNTIQKEVTKQRGDVHSKNWLFFLGNGILVGLQVSFCTLFIQFSLNNNTMVVIHEDIWHLNY